ncbi:MAG: hypothetical protein KDC38_14500, partial [Planctomycetes bacterium]|nr:hypothetical protein [Planctomycetota bacterium]
MIPWTDRVHPILRAVGLTLFASFLLSAAPAPAASVSKLSKALARAAKSEDYDQVRQLLAELGETDDAKAAKVIVQSLGALPLHEIAPAAIDALARLGSEHCAKTFDKLIDGKSTAWEILAVITMTAEKIGDERAEGWIAQAIATGRPVVMRNAIPVAVKLKSKAAIPALMDLLETVGYNRTNESYQVRKALL